MKNLPKQVFIQEVGPRDGFQMEKQIIPTEDKITVIDMLSECGFKEIQFTAFVNPKAVPNMADATELCAKIKRKPGVNYVALIPNKRGYERANEVGIKKVELTLSATDSHNISNLNCTSLQSITQLEECLALGLDTEISVGLAVVFGCPFEGRPPFERIKMLVDKTIGLGIKELTLADTSGVGDPVQVYDICSRLKDAYPQIHFNLHLHNTHGTSIANIVAAMQAGIFRFDSSVSGLGGCPFAPGASGNVATEDLFQILSFMGIETGIDIDKIISVAQHTAKIVGHSDSATLRAGKMGSLAEGGSAIQP